MFDTIFIVSFGGGVLWQRSTSNSAPSDRLRYVNRLISEVLLEDRAGMKEYTVENYKLHWHLMNEEHLCAVSVTSKFSSFASAHLLLKNICTEFSRCFPQASQRLSLTTAESATFNEVYDGLWTKFEHSELVSSASQPVNSTADEEDTEDGSQNEESEEDAGPLPKAAGADGEVEVAGDRKGGVITTKGGRKLVARRRGGGQHHPDEPSKRNKDEGGSPNTQQSTKPKKAPTRWDVVPGAYVDEAAEKQAKSGPTEEELQAQAEMQKAVYIKRLANGKVAPVQEKDWGDTDGERRSRLSAWLRTYVGGSRGFNEEDLQRVLPNLREKLIGKNVSVEVAEDVCSSVEASLKGKKLGTFESMYSAIDKAMTATLRRILQPKHEINILRDVAASKRANKPYTIVMCGVNGVGKSTSLAKIAYWLQQNQFSVMVAAGDTFRHGAVEQLQVHGRCLNIQVYQQGYGTDPSAVAAGAVATAARQHQDVVIVDTAGRQQNHASRMRALAKLIHDNQPDLVLFVGEALVGNNGVDQLRKFNQCLVDYAPVGSACRGIDGIVLTKFDTMDDKVGAAVSMVYELGQPIVFVGVGQTYQDLKVIEPDVVIHKAKLLLMRRTAVSALGCAVGRRTVLLDSAKPPPPKTKKVFFDRETEGLSPGLGGFGHYAGSITAFMDPTKVKTPTPKPCEEVEEAMRKSSSTPLTSPFAPREYLQRLESVQAQNMAGVLQGGGALPTPHSQGGPQLSAARSPPAFLSGGPGGAGMDGMKLPLPSPARPNAIPRSSTSSLPRTPPSASTASSTTTEAEDYYRSLPRNALSKEEMWSKIQSAHASRQKEAGDASRPQSASGGMVSPSTTAKRAVNLDPQAVDYAKMEEELRENDPWHLQLGAYAFSGREGSVVLGEEEHMQHQRRYDYYTMWTLVMALNKARWNVLEVNAQRGVKTTGAGMKVLFWKEAIRGILKQGSTDGVSFTDSHPVLRPFANVVARNPKMTKTFVRGFTDARLRTLNQPANVKQLFDHFDKFYGYFFNSLLEVTHLQDEAAEHALLHIGRANGITNHCVMFWKKYAALGVTMLPADLCADHCVHLGLLKRLSLASRDRAVRRLLCDMMGIAKTEMIHAEKLAKDVNPKTWPLLMECFYPNYYLTFLQKRDFNVSAMFADYNIENVGFTWFRMKKRLEWQRMQSIERLLSDAAPVPLLNRCVLSRGSTYKMVTPVRGSGKDVDNTSIGLSPVSASSQAPSS